MQRLLRFAILLIAVVAVAIVASRLRGRGTGIPAASPSEPPAPPAPAAADDLTHLRGIGPVYRARLAEAGITSFTRLAEADPDVVATATGVPPSRAADWIAQAAGRTVR